MASALDHGIVTAANWSEVLQKARRYGGDPYEVGLLLRSLGIKVIDVTQEDGENAALIWTREAALSLGDRLCLAAAARLGLPAMTADAEWERVNIENVEIEVIRGR